MPLDLGRLIDPAVIVSVEEKKVKAKTPLFSPPLSVKSLVDQCGKIMRPTCSVSKGTSCYCQCSNVSHLRHKFITVSYMPCAICLHYHKLFPLEMLDWKTKCTGSFHAREMNFIRRKLWPHSNLIHSLVSVKSLSIPHVGIIISL